MQMSDVVQVIQVAGSADANSRLAEGWKLLAITSADSGQGDGKTIIWYVLGKPVSPEPQSLRAPTARATAAIAEAQDALKHIK